MNYLTAGVACASKALAAELAGSLATTAQDATAALTSQGLHQPSPNENMLAYVIDMRKTITVYAFSHMPLRALVAAATAVPKFRATSRPTPVWEFSAISGPTKDTSVAAHHAKGLQMDVVP